MKSAITLDRLLSRFGIASRQEGQEAVRHGRLKVNGRVVRDPEFWVSPAKDVVHLDGRRLKPSRKVYLLFYKPRGVITSNKDPQGRRTVYEYKNEAPDWLFPVGRLDKDTSGLLLMTNDTEFADFVANPQSHVAKTYRAKINALLSDEIIGQLQSGIQMRRGDWAKPLAVRRLEDRGRYTWLEVRRMIEAVGFKVLKLVRTGIGLLSLQGLEIGQWRKLTPGEVAALRSSAISRQRVKSQLPLAKTPRRKGTSNITA